MADKNLDEYQAKRFYSTNTKARQNGFAKFEKDGAYYFALYQDDDIVLLSQAYKGIAGRDNGVESVKKNRRISKRYRFDTRAGKKHGFGLYAGNGQEIAISANHTSRAAAERAAARLSGAAKSGTKKAGSTPAKATPKKTSAKKVTPKKTETAKAKATAKTKTDGRVENYHPLAFYERHGGGVKNGFDSFSEGKAHYFSFNKDGKTILISESYTSRAGHDNGIASVKKNIPLKQRYEHHKHKNGKYYFDLNASNGQEIATSVWYGSAAAALAAAAALRGEKAKVKPASKTKTKKAITAGAGLTATAAKAKRRNAKDEDNYHPLAFYNKHIKGRKSGIETFKGEDGLYYFTVFENGKIRLISEGYPTVNARDTGAASVKKNIEIEKRYDYRGPFKNGKYDYRLKAGNGKEIARSVWYGSAAAAATGAAYLMGTRKRAKPKAVSKKTAAAAGLGAAALGTSAAAAASKSTPKAKPKTKAVPQVKPEAAEPIPPATAKPAAHIAKPAAPIAAAAAIAGTGAVAAGTTEAASAAAAAVGARTSDAGGGFSWGFLKWLLPILILLALPFFGLKACSTKKSQAKLQAQAFAAAKIAEDKAAAEKKVAAEKAAAEKAAKLKAEAEAKAKALAAAKAKAEAEEAELLSRSTPTVEPAPASNKSIYDGVNTKPVSVTYLGSNPQFGDSHGLTPSQFYDKLNARYVGSSWDAKYLDYVFKELGYTGGFKDVDASAFSNQTLPQGVTGFLGVGQQHALQYSSLNVTDSRDLESFRVKSKYGCDINFMKSCGNYMNTCE